MALWLKVSIGRFEGFEGGLVSKGLQGIGLATKRERLFMCY